jgi:hypothetical protein
LAVEKGEIGAREAIKRMIMRQPFPINESFKQMMGNMRETADMLLELRGEEFPCHKIVITATSEYFKKAIKENDYINKYQFKIRGPYR